MTIKGVDNKNSIAKVEVKQTHKIYTLAVDKEALLFGNYLNEEVRIFNIESNDAWTIEIENNDWLTIDQTEGEGDAEIRVTTKPNTSQSEKVLEIIIKGVKNKNNTATITTKQAAKSANILDYIPDPIFKKHLIDKVFNGATFASEEDARKVEAINASGSIDTPNTIESLEGLYFFTGLKDLQCNNNSIKTLDISKNTKLTLLHCTNNQIEILDTSKNIQLIYLACFSNKLKNLDLSQNSNLSQLDCSNNLLTDTSVLIPNSVYNNALAVLKPSKPNAIYKIVD